MHEASLTKIKCLYSVNGTPELSYSSELSSTSKKFYFSSAGVLNSEDSFFLSSSYIFKLLLKL